MRGSTVPTVADDLQKRAKALGDPTRFRIFRYVFEADRPVGVAELTDYTQLNHNAVRQHLAVLTAAGLVVETIEERTRPGRPRLLYAPAPETTGMWGSAGPYEYLATLLSEVLRSGTDPEEVGRAAGLRRAAELRRANERAPRRPAVDPADIVYDEMARIGFRPERRERAHSIDLVLGRCPFESAAAANPGVVCQIHRGLVAGLSEGSGTVALDDLVVKNPHRGGCRVVLRTDKN